nr:uncharacterized protein LOC119624833 [Chlorocebus sabaeus]
MRPSDSLHLRPCSLSSLLRALFSKHDPLYLQNRKSAAGTGEAPPPRRSQQHGRPGNALPPTSWVTVSTAARRAREPRGPTEPRHQMGSCSASRGHRVGLSRARAARPLPGGGRGVQARHVASAAHARARGLAGVSAQTREAGSGGAVAEWLRMGPGSAAGSHRCSSVLGPGSPLWNHPAAHPRARGTCVLSRRKRVYWADKAGKRKEAQSKEAKAEKSGKMG